MSTTEPILPAALQNRDVAFSAPMRDLLKRKEASQARATRCILPWQDY